VSSEITHERLDELERDIHGGKMSGVGLRLATPILISSLRAAWGREEEQRRLLSRVFGHMNSTEYIDMGSHHSAQGFDEDEHDALYVLLLPYREEE
jgi:hypothetical protein